MLVAFPPEWAAMVPHVTVDGDHRLHGRRVIEGRFAGKPVILAQTGVSMVNAAMTTQALLDRFTVSRIVVSGVAGGLDPSNSVGRVLAPARWGQALEVGMGRETPAGPVLPPLPGATDLPPFGMMIPRDVIVGRDGEGERERRWFEVDADLLALARRLEDGHDLRVGGAGLSGAAFVDNAAYRDYLFATFQAAVVDMETTAVAQVAFANRVPFIAFRSLSDLAGGEPDDNHLPLWLERACANVAAVTRAFIASLP
ncbi:5'-methylthioadenosine/S-adenosylhomocysteine nucleosidase [Sphingomonas floccifaciens]|uniref:5'-methylthioadenosine/S-adenosylhomocysteine nucleosidase n=1 Tax=Sphingomonas floccifaciens TaxID=1844115 RepID=A0ABW4N9R6_9SPHN